jgi:hypothetical protein
VRPYQGAVISCGNFHQGQTYQVWLDGTVTGTELGGVYDVTTITAYEGGIRQAYTGTDVTRGPGGFGGIGQPPQIPEGMEQPPRKPDGEHPTMPGGETMPSMPQGQRPPDGEMPPMPEGDPRPNGPQGQMPPGGFSGGQHPGSSTDPDVKANTLFYMQDNVNCFSGITAAQ